MKIIVLIFYSALFLVASTLLYAQDFSLITTIAFTETESSATAWGDYDNDGDLDLLISGDIGSYPNSIPYAAIYRNEGNNSFTELTDIGISGAYYGSVDWGDYDNDGDLDILLAGRVSEWTDITKVFKNNGDGTFIEQSGIILQEISLCQVEWGDYDNDGYLDILICGYAFSDLVAKIYRNDGNGNFIEQNGISLKKLKYSAIAWGDYDNDGDLDLVISGFNLSNFTRIYNNEGNNVFTALIDVDLIGIKDGSVVWGDYDNDQDLDLLVVGNESTYDNLPVAKLYKNEGQNIFTEIEGLNLIGTSYSGSAEWGDFNNDGWLDILITGYNGSRLYRNNTNNTFTQINESDFLSSVYASASGDFDNDGDLDIFMIGTSESGLFRNNTTIVNQEAYPPENLNASQINDTVWFSWDKSNAGSTPQDGLSYNIRIGTSPGACNIQSPMALSDDGFRLIPDLGNAQQNTNKKCILPPNTYYWSVQAIDHTYQGSEWSIEQIYTKELEAPVLLFPEDHEIIYSSSITFRWEPQLGVENYVLEVSLSSDFEFYLVNDSSVIDNEYHVGGIEPGTTYYWRVSSMAQSSYAESETWQFTTVNTAPGKPDLVYPENDSIVRWSGIRLIWENVQYTEMYELQVSESPSFGTLFFSSEELTDTSLLITSLESETSYYWHVRSRNLAGSSDWSHTWQFSCQISVPTIPELQNPQNGSEYQPNSITFSWNPADSADNYQLQLSLNSDFENPEIDESGIENTYKTLNDLKYGKKYYWRVKAINEGGESDWSNIWWFKVESGAAGDWSGYTSNNKLIRFSVNDNYEITSLNVKISTSFCIYEFYSTSNIRIENRSFQAEIINPFIFDCSGESIVLTITGIFTDNTHCTGTISGFTGCTGFCGDSYFIGTINVSEQTWSATGEIYFNALQNQPDFEQDIECYPNPTEGCLIITNRYNDPMDIAIISMDGKCLNRYKQNNGFAELDISDLNRGVYFVEVYTPNKAQTFRVFKY